MSSFLHKLTFLEWGVEDVAPYNLDMDIIKLVENPKQIRELHQ